MTTTKYNHWVNTTEYTVRWGQPRGRGWWLFRIGPMKTPYSIYGTYTECRARAIEVAKSTGTTEILLLA